MQSVFWHVHAESHSWMREGRSWCHGEIEVKWSVTRKLNLLNVISEHVLRYLHLLSQPRGNCWSAMSQQQTVNYEIHHLIWINDFFRYSSEVEKKKNYHPKWWRIFLVNQTNITVPFRFTDKGLKKTLTSHVRKNQLCLSVPKITQFLQTEEALLLMLMLPREST